MTGSAMTGAARNGSAIPSSAISGAARNRATSPRSHGPRRCLSWLCLSRLGAVVLLVLVATAGLPAADHNAGNSHRIEVVEGIPARPLVVGEARPDGNLGAGAAPALPRQVPRTRSVSARGLPPARAPTS